MGSLYRSQHELLPLFKNGTAPHVNNVELGGMAGWPPVCAILSQSAMVTPAAKPSTSSCAKAMSLRCPGDPIRRTGFPSASPAAWILVLRPPRERPRPWASGPLFAGECRRRADAPARWSSRSSTIRDRPRPPTWRGSRPERPSRSSDSSGASPPCACPTAWADRASDSLSAPSTAGRSETDDCWCGDRAGPCARQAQTPHAAPTGHPEARRSPPLTSKNQR
jgi:hypothetical protein